MRIGRTLRLQGHTRTGVILRAVERVDGELDRRGRAVIGAVLAVFGGDRPETGRCEPFCGPRSGSRDWLAGRIRRVRGVGGVPALLVLVAERFVQAVVVEPADVLDDRELELGAGAPHAVGDQLGVEGIDERLGERVVQGIPDGADRGEHPVVVERLGVVDARVLPEFKGPSHRLDEEGCDGSGSAPCGGSCGAASDAVARSSVGGAAGGAAAVLPGSRGWRVERGRGCCSGRFAGGGRPVVPRGWRDAIGQPGVYPPAQSLDSNLFRYELKFGSLAPAARWPIYRRTSGAQLGLLRFADRSVPETQKLQRFRGEPAVLGGAAGACHLTA
jgi:hypothetical protein